MFAKIKNKVFIFHQKWILQTSNRYHLKILRGALYFISICWGGVVYIKNLCFKYQIFASHRLKIPVISVGNIVAGGTGKTPLVIKLLQTISLNKNMGLLSRGYKAGIKKQLIVQPQGENLLLDEPALIQKKIPNLYCFLGKNRLQLGKIAEKMNIDLLVMDDGLQYRKIKKDFEIITMNAFDLFGQNYFLPRGLLRDTPARLKEADCIVVNYVKDQGHYQTVCSILSSHCSCPIVGVHPTLSFVSLENKSLLSPKEKAGVFCGIAHPKSFIDLLIKKNIEIVSTIILSDHEKIQGKRLEMFSKECEKKGAMCIMCTEKDLTSFPSNLKLPIVVAKMDLEISFGKEHWQLMIEKIQDRLDNCGSTVGT